MTVLHGASFGECAERGPHGISRNLRTLSHAVTRYGLTDLAKRTLRTLRSGGASLLLQKFRQQRALACFQHLPAETSASDPSSAATAVQSTSEGGAFVLREDFGLPIGEFTRFMHLWHRHPAIGLLTREASPRAITHTIVIAPHPAHGFDRVRETLDFADHLARRTGHAVRPVVYVGQDQPLPKSLAEAAGCPALVVARGIRDLRAAIAGADSTDPVQFLVSGDQICPVLAEVLTCCRLPAFDVVLTDMYYQESDHTAHLFLLPGIDAIHALNADYFLSRAILSAGLAHEVLAGQDRFDAYELIASALSRCAGRAEARAHHVAFPMLRIAETSATIGERRLALLSRSSPLRLPSEARLRLGRASIVICTKNNGFLLEQLVESLERTCAAILADIVVVSNRPTDPHAAAVHGRLAAQGRVKLIKYDEPFNFSAQSNLGAAAAAGDILLFLNDDVVPLNRDWLDQLTAPLQDPAIGIVGPLLLYPDQSVQHAGMFLGYNRLAGHALRGARLPQGDCGFMGTAPRQVMAVTGAALAMRRADFETLGGFDRNLFALHIQDVDLCLRAHFSGLAVIYNPRAVLLHMESVSVKPTLADPWIGQRRALEHAAFHRRWGDVIERDAFVNPNISLIAEDLRTFLEPGDSQN